MLFHLKKNRGNLTKKSKVLNFRYVLTNMSIHVSILYYNDLLLNNQKTITNLKNFCYSTCLFVTVIFKYEYLVELGAWQFKFQKLFINATSYKIEYNRKNKKSVC